MKLTDCVWELENLGRRVCEIIVEADDIFDENEIIEKTKAFDYVVIKVGMACPAFNFGLTQLGFTMVETQLNISKKFKDFNFEDRLVKRLLPHVDIKIVTSYKDLDGIINRITPDMFSTDRIYLDPRFEKSSSMIRYSNWIRTEFQRNTSIIKEILYDGVAIGFDMQRENNGIVSGLLGGIYEGEQAAGYGLLTASSRFLSAKTKESPFVKMRTSISSNNIPMLQIYNYLHFIIDNMTYVFVKHNN